MRKQTLEDRIAVRDETIDELIAERNEALERFKRAATDLAAQAEELAGYKHRAGLADDLLNAQSAEILSLRPDALLWRAARLKRRGNK